MQNLTGTSTQEISVRTKSHRKTNGEGSVFQRADGRWSAKIQIGTKENGKPLVKSFYGKKRKDAVEKLDRYKKEHDLGMNDIGKMTVDEVITDWLQNVKRIKLKPTSYDRLESTIILHVIPAIGYHKFAELTTAQIQQELINPMFDQNDSYSDIKKAYNAIGACYKHAIGSHKIQYNPALNVEMSSSKLSEKEIFWFKKEEILSFEKRCKAIYKNGKLQYILGYGMIFILNTGLRIGEALALTWRDIDFDKRIASVVKNVEEAKDRKSDSQKRVLINQDSLKTKNGYRYVNLNNKAMDALMQLKKARYFGEDSFILCNKDGKQNKYHNVLRTFKAIIKRAGIPDCGLHSLRHTFVTQLLAKGKRIEEVAALIGDNPATVLKTYSHVIEKLKAEDVAALDDIG